jgi:hypothetical protein
MLRKIKLASQQNKPPAVTAGTSQTQTEKKDCTKPNYPTSLTEEQNCQQSCTRKIKQPNLWQNRKVALKETSKESAQEIKQNQLVYQIVCRQFNTNQ